MWKRGEIAPKEQFLLFSTLLYIYIYIYIYIFLTSGVKLHIHLLNMVVQFIVFLTLSTLICRSTDISKCFSESLGIWDNESRLYVHSRLILICIYDCSWYCTSWNNNNNNNNNNNVSNLPNILGQIGLNNQCRPWSITKTCLYNFDPLKPHFYIVKLGFTGVHIISLISAQNIDCGYSLEPPRRGGSNEYPQSMFWAEIWKISKLFIWKFSFFGG